MKASDRFSPGPSFAIFVATALAAFVVSNHAAFAATDANGRGLETLEHRYYDSAHLLHVDIRIRHIPLEIRHGRHPSSAGGGGRRHRDSTTAAAAAPNTDETGVYENGVDAQGSSAVPDSPVRFFTAPGYGPPLSNAAHPILPMPLAP